MPVKQRKALLDSHENLLAEFLENIRVPKKGKEAPSVDVAIQLKERHLETLRGNFDARAAALEHQRRAVEQGATEISQLEAEIARERKELEKARAAPPPGRQAAQKVKGVGKVTAADLMKAKIVTVSDLAAASQKKVAEAVGISKERAKTLIEEAKKTARG